jgi:uncharacterized protein (TIGR02646 family)
MIHIDRARPDANGQAIRPRDPWTSDAGDATTRALGEGGAHQVEDLYRDPKAKAALEELFHRKCAYCEAPLANATWDVEHFRPKGRVKESQTHPGYYWLAYTWENLYPSCTFCNQKRKDAPTWSDPTTGAAQGKLDQFPLADETQRAVDYHGNLANEQPLMLDPCQAADDPESHFAFDSQGQILARDPADVRARETIRICNLKRRRLRDERAKVLVRVVHMVRVLDLATGSGQLAIVPALQALLGAEVQDSAQYAAVARTVQRDPAAFSGIT